MHETQIESVFSGHIDDPNEQRIPAGLKSRRNRVRVGQGTSYLQAFVELNTVQPQPNKVVRTEKDLDTPLLRCVNFH